MADQSLFGVTDPALVQQAIQAQEQAAMLQQAQLTPAQMQNFMQLQAGSQIGKGIGGIVGSLFGIETVDPRVKKAQMAQGIINEVNMMGIDPNSPDYMAQVSKLAITRGLPDLAQMATAKAQDMSKTIAETKLKLAQTDVELKKAKAEASPFGKIDISKVTPESYKIFQQTQNIADLVFKKEEDKKTEFENLIAGLPPAEQAKAKADYLRKLTNQSMPPTMQTFVLREADSLGALTNTTADVKTVLGDLTGGKLKLSPGDNFVNAFKTFAASSTEGSRAYNNFNSTLATLQNQALLLNKGTQTEGDAIRALNEFMSGYSKYDTKTAIDQLQRVVKKFDVAIESKRNNIVATGNRYGEDLSMFLPAKQQSVQTAPKYSDDVIMREFNDPKNAAWKSRGFEAFKNAFIKANP